MPDLAAFRRSMRHDPKGWLWLMAGISTAYTSFVVLQYDYAPVDAESLLARVLDVSAAITAPISVIMPIIVIYSGKLTDLGYPYLIPVLENIYAINLVLLVVFIALSLKHLDRFNSKIREDIDYKLLPRFQATKKISLTKNISLTIALIAGYFFLFGDPTMEHPGKYADRIYLNKWNFSRAPLWMSFIYFFLMYYLALRRRSKSSS